MGVIKHIFTVDVEDWHHAFPPSVFRAHTSIDRLEIGMGILLDQLEEHSTKATFFWLGTCAEHAKQLLKKVHERGHEIGCHGYEHTAVFLHSPQQFHDDTYRATSVIADVTGHEVKAFRAPYFSIRRDTRWALEILISLGIEFDSSILPMYHGNTGMPWYTDSIHSIETPSGPIIEVPVSMRSFTGVHIPVTGGGYFRGYPYSLTRSNIRHRERNAKPTVFYIHPWELDHEHPHLAGLGLPKLIHYLGLRHSLEKLQQLLDEFSFAPLMETARQTLGSASGEGLPHILSTNT